MSLRLCNRDIRRFRAASRALLSPLEHRTLDGWGQAVNDALCALFGAQRAAVVLPRPTHVHFTLRDFDPESVEPFKETLTATEPGMNRYADPLLEHSMTCLRRAGAPAWTSELAEHLSGIPSPKIPLFQDVLIPGGLAHITATGAAHDHGMALCGVYHDGPEVDPFGQARLELMELLAPSFEAGVRILDRLEAVRTALETVLDQLPDPLLICEPTGSELHRNPALDEMLQREPGPQREQVVSAMRGVAVALGRLEPGAPDAGGPVAASAGAGRIDTERHRYSFHGSFVRAGVLGRRGAIVVSARRAAPLLPSPQALVEHWRLTPRQAEVARRMALGQSNAEIAAGLCRSPHTIRHHAEHVFRKLGIHSRKALALKLLGAEGGEG